MRNILLSSNNSKGQTIAMTNETIRLVAFLAIFGAVMILTLAQFRTQLSSSSDSVTNESNLFVGTSVILASVSGDPRVLGNITAINNGTNNTIGVNNVVHSLNGSVIQNAGFNIASGARVNFSYDFTFPSNAQNAIDNSTRSINNTFQQLPLFGTIVGLLLIIGLIFVIFRYGKEQGSQSV